MSGTVASPGSKRPVHIFDVCGTLFREDTTMGLLKWHALRRRHLTRFSLLSALHSRKSPIRWGLMVCEKLLGRHILKHMALKTLWGEVPADVLDSAHEYISHLRSTCWVPSIEDRFKRALESDVVLLASASIEPAIAALAQQFSLEYVSSTLETHRGRYTGRYCKDMSGQKIEALVAKFGADCLGVGTSCYSDNFSDKGLLEACERRTVVIHKPRHRRRWTLEQTEYIDLK